MDLATLFENEIPLRYRLYNGVFSSALVLPRFPFFNFLRGVGHCAFRHALVDIALGSIVASLDSLFQAFLSKILEQNGLQFSRN